MIVVSDTGPINYLVLTGAADALFPLFGTILIPEAVYRELHSPSTPPIVRGWVDANTGLIEVRRVAHARVAGDLHAGEREAICLALECGADVVLVDDAEARAVAREYGLTAAGTLGVLERASGRGLIDFPAAIERLRQTNFHISERLLQDALDRHRRADDTLCRDDPDHSSR